MTTEERIADLETEADFELDRGGDVGAMRALVYEIRALRLMLREEIREAAWPMRQAMEIGTKLMRQAMEIGTKLTMIVERIEEATR